MAELFDSEINSIFDRLVPYPQVIRQRRSDVWFVSDWREAKRLTRRFERAYAVAVRNNSRKSDCSVSTTFVEDAKSAWHAQRRSYRNLRCSKRSGYYAGMVETNHGLPERLWSTIDQLLGRGPPPVNTVITAEDFSRFWAESVNSPNFYCKRACSTLYNVAHSSNGFSCFRRVTPQDVIAAVWRLPA